MAVRIYVVETENEMSLVRATTASQALSYTAKGKYQVRPATAEDAVQYLAAGGAVEDATAPKEDVGEELAPEAEA